MENHALIRVYPQLRGFEAMRLLNLAYVRGLSEGGSLHEQILGSVTLTLLEVIDPMVPVITGTLRSAQFGDMDPDEGMAWIRTAPIRNPLFGEFANQYVNDVHARKPFYADAIAEGSQLLESQIYDEVGVWLSS